jgi:CRP-like cAMP-binding protein
VVRKGWLISYTVLQDGRRQVLELHCPGDVIGTPDMPFKHSTSNLLAIEECVLCPFPKSAIGVIFTRSPRLTALLFTLAMIDKSVNLDRLRVLGRMSARERLAHILPEIYSRITLTNGVVGNSFRLPLSQFDLAAAVGLTNVSISNAFAKLEGEQLIKRSKGHVELLDTQKLTAISDDINRYREVDISWFPNV